MESCILWLCNKKSIWLWNWIWNQGLPFFIDNQICKGFIFWKQSSIKGVLMSFNHVSNNYWQTSTMLHQSWKSGTSSKLWLIDSCQQRSAQTLTQQSISLQWTFLQTIITNTCSKHWLCLLHDRSQISPMV